MATYIATYLVLVCSTCVYLGLASYVKCSYKQMKYIVFDWLVFKIDSMHVQCTYSIYSCLALNGNAIVNKSSIILHIGFESSALHLLQQKHHDHYHDYHIALKYFTIINRAWHH